MTRRRQASCSSLEQLELRTLPAVTVTLSGGGVLKIKGNAAGDDVLVEGLGNSGNVSVRVNGNLVDNFDGVKNIKAALGDGNDSLELQAVEIPGNLTVNLGDGADEFIIEDDTEIAGFVKANLGGDTGDFVEWKRRVEIGGNVTLNGVADLNLEGLGASSANDAEDIDIGGNLIIKLVNSGDVNGDNEELELSNVNVFGKTTLTGSNKTDRLDIFDSSFTGNFIANLGDGDDEIDVATEAVDKNEFLAAAIFNGGDGDDEAKFGDENDFAQPQVVNNFETVS